MEEARPRVIQGTNEMIRAELDHDVSSLEDRLDEIMSCKEDLVWLAEVGYD